MAPEIEIEEISSDEDVATSQTLPLAKKPRASATTKQLDARRERDENDSEVERIKKQLFNYHICKRLGCENECDTCLLLQSRGSHHKVLKKELERWVNMVANDVPGITIERPPQEWTM